MDATKIILSGCCGKMGRTIAACAAEREDCVIVAGIDLVTEPYSDFPIFSQPADCTVSGDVIVDFSHPSNLTRLLSFALREGKPVVLATTGYSREQIEELTEASKKIPVFFSFNMSLGVNLLIDLAKRATKALGSSFDVEIIEKHHNQKLDAPSGTAIMLANAIRDTMATDPVYVYDRHSQRKKRTNNEIGIHSVRGGTIVGDHEVIFAGKDEVITLSHTAYSKAVFATGSLNAARFLHRQQPGLYSMGDLV